MRSDSTNSNNSGDNNISSKGVSMISNGTHRDSNNSNTSGSGEMKQGAAETVLGGRVTVRSENSKRKRGGAAESNREVETNGDVIRTRPHTHRRDSLDQAMLDIAGVRVALWPQTHHTRHTSWHFWKR